MPEPWRGIIDFAAAAALVSGGQPSTLLAKGELRRKAIIGLASGGAALFLLLGNPHIMERFLTTFHDVSEARQSAEANIAYSSAQSRVMYGPFDKRECASPTTAITERSAWTEPISKLNHEDTAAAW